MKTIRLLLFLVLACTSGVAPAQVATPFRPPAVPLITHDPYFSIWSPYNLLSEGATSHWTGTAQSLSSMANIDGKAYPTHGQAGRGRGHASDGRRGAAYPHHLSI